MVIWWIRILDAVIEINGYVYGIIDWFLNYAVLGAEKDKLKDQYVYQSKRSLVGSNDRKRQIWNYTEERKLILTDKGQGVFALVTK